MSILIRGMEMPKGNSTINVLIYADGTVYTGHVNDSRYSAVSVPTSHGRLIDVSTVEEIRFHDADGYHVINGEQLCELEIDADTVIEAEGETDGR